MRCKKHLTDLSSSVGVCASCLRERLFILVAVQAQAQEDRRKSDSHLPPPPVHLPLSASPPRIPRQNSERNHHRRNRQSLKDQLFFSTPQVGPTRAYDYGNSPAKEKVKSTARFSLFSRLLFRSRAKKGMESDLYSVNSSGASTSNGSWFSNMLSGHRKKQPAAEFGRRTGRNRDRGMSPARVSDYGDEAEDWFEGTSGYSSASSRSWWQTPRRAGSRRGGAGGRMSQSRNGMAFCLSPLVRASPGRSWNGKGVTPDTAFSGEIRFPVNLSTAAAFCANRSRKLADFGRSNHNH